MITKNRRDSSFNNNALQCKSILKCATSPIIKTNKSTQFRRLRKPGLISTDSDQKNRSATATRAKNVQHVGSSPRTTASGENCSFCFPRHCYALCHVERP